MEEKEPEGEEEGQEGPSPADLNRLIHDLKSFLFQLESEGYTKESLVLLLSKFETNFQQDTKNLPKDVSTAMNSFIQHGFEYAEGKEGQDSLIHDLENIQEAIVKVKKSEEGE